MEMEEQYGIMDLTHYMNGRPVFTTVQQPVALPQPHHGVHYEMVTLGGGGGGGMMYRSDSATGTASTTASLSAGGGGGGGGGGVGLEMEIGGGNGRWPRQETLTLLEVRSRLDSKFKEANQKGPLWDEVSRIMSEEHGYQRSGKKCREKFENLYKYYKKTKEGKAGRQDGKHYRFFRQLEALYGEASTSANPVPNPASFSDTHNLSVGTSTFEANPHPNHSYQEAFQQAPSRLCDSLSLSNSSSAFDTSSSDYSNLNAAMPPFMESSHYAERIVNRKRVGKRNWKAKIKEFIDKQLRKIIERQEAWMEKMMKTIEQKEQERISREEQWRKEEEARFEREHMFWAKERAWMESRDSALMETLHKLTGKESINNKSSSPKCDDQSPNDHNNGRTDSSINLMGWGENEVTRLMQLRTGMETRFEQGGYMEDILWEEIASKMACLGYNRNGLMCKAKWESINEFLTRTKRRKENMRSSNSYSHISESLPHSFHQMGGYREADESVAPNYQQNDSSWYRFLMGDPQNMWDSYGMKLTKGENH